MSKRSSRRKRKQKQKRERVRLSGPGLTRQGLEAFKQANYDEAVKAWEQARDKSDVPVKLPAALAEAYFRRAMSQARPGLADLQQAVKLQPADSRYRYHLALAHHRLGELDQAEPIYRQLLAGSPPFGRAAVPLAQLLIEQKKALSNDSVWNHLSPEAQTQLAAAEALIKKKAVSTLRRLADSPLEPLWRGLIALALNDQATARQSLQAVLESGNELHPLPRSVACYYLGRLAAAAGYTEQALGHWQAAQAGGLDTPHLRRNLSILSYQQAVHEQQAGHPQRAIKLLERVYNLDAANQNVRDLHHQLNLEMGYTAARKGDWGQALRQWQAARDAGDTSRKLLFNLALAYQHLDRSLEAAEHWRELLRRRPRKATHPEALSNEQVARIWQNVAENYSKAGDYEEAIKTYKNAVKWAPDNINLRLKLVEAFQTEGRWQAAENELHRILDKEPDHVLALTLLAESYSNDYFPDRARSIWLRILELEPQNPVARQQLAYLYEKQGYSLARWGMFERALNIYQEGLRMIPDSQRLCAVIGTTYADLGDFDQARQYFERALAINPNDLQTLYTIYTAWLEYESEPDLDQTFDRIKALPGSSPGGFFIDLIDRCIEVDQWEQAEAILKFAKERYTHDTKTLLDLALRYVNLEQEAEAVSILRRILKDDPNHAEANLRLGMIYYQMGQTRLGRRHWHKAETQARKENNYMLLHELKIAKDVLIHGKPPPRTPLEMLKGLPPEVLESMLSQAPPEIANLIRNLDPEMLEAMLDFADMDDEEFYDFYDEDDFYYA